MAFSSYEPKSALTWTHQTMVDHRALRMHYISRTVWYNRLFSWNGIMNCEISFREITLRSNRSLQKYLESSRPWQHHQRPQSCIWGDRLDAQNQHQGMSIISNSCWKCKNESPALKMRRVRIAISRGRCSEGALSENWNGKSEYQPTPASRKWRLGKIPELERELRASKERIAKLERESEEQREATRHTVTKMNEKLVLMETRLHEAGVSQGEKRVNPHW